VTNLIVPEGAIVVFVGTSSLDGAEAGEGGTGGYSVNGNSTWMRTLSSRGLPGFSLWGGSISFDSSKNWYFGNDTRVLNSTYTDFYTVATHELGHVLGFGTASTFPTYVSGQGFTGPATVAINGGRAPNLSADLAHFAYRTYYGTQPTSMQPYLLSGQRYGFTPLDYAVLADIGWQMSPVSPPPPILPPPPPPPVVIAPIVNLSSDPFLIGGSANGSVGTYRFETPAEQASTKDAVQPAIVSGPRLLTQIGSSIQPFGGFSGTIRSAMADVNGDGTLDMAFVTGAGGVSRLRVVDGQNGNDLMPVTAVFGDSFTGGLFIATADFDRDGKADIIVSPDRGGGGRVTIFNLANGVKRSGDFFGIEDVNFRGGARVAAADINGDGTPDLVVGAGTGGGPRIALFNGLTIGKSKPDKLIGDFFAFPGEDALALRNGVYVAAGDLNGDGHADLIFGAGPGGGPRIFILDGATVLSGNIDAARFNPLANFFAFDSSDRGGVQVAVKDVDGDDRLDLLAGSGAKRQVATWFGASGDWAGKAPGTAATFAPSSLSGTMDGVYVG
jgi:hypothetical protein